MATHSVLAWRILESDSCLESDTTEVNQQQQQHASIRMAKMKKTVRSNVGKDSEQLNI